MNYCYVDESGDLGAYYSELPGKSGTKYFILSGVIVSGNKWKQCLNALKAFRKDIAAKSYLNYDVEFHCAELIDPRKIKEYTQISVPDRWMLIENFADIIAKSAGLQIISVVIDKSNSRIPTSEYLTTGITKIYQAFDEFLRYHKESGMLFFDRANEKIITTHARKLMGTGSSGTTIPGIRIGWIIEDPIFRISTVSIFVQAADVVAYTLKEKEFPQTSRKKLQAHKIFDRKLISAIFKFVIADDDGIIRI